MSADCLILGLAAGYHEGDVRPFASSLARSGFAGRCVLFVSPTTRDQERIAAHGVEVAGFTRPEGLGRLPMNALRFFLYLDFLRAAARPFARILLTDVRDVVFQADPFGFPWPDGLSAALEHGGRSVGECPYTARWVRLHLGEATLADLRHRPVSCSGTTLGSHAAVLGYLEAMTRLLLPFTPAAHMAGYDQGVHNHLLHAGLVPDVTFHDNAGPILTLGWKKEAPAVDAQGDILNEAGKPALIAHQYDRHPALLARVRARYA